MMADFSATYTAKLGVDPSHLVDTEYTFEVDLRLLDPTDKIDASQNLTPNDAETSFNSITTEYDVETKLMDRATRDLCREFLLSCSGSELFTVSLEGAASQNAHLILDRTVRPTREGLKYRYRFKIRVY
jgi:hypothetical protein